MLFCWSGFTVVVCFVFLSRRILPRRVCSCQIHLARKLGLCLLLFDFSFGWKNDVRHVRYRIAENTVLLVLATTCRHQQDGGDETNNTWHDKSFIHSRACVVVENSTLMPAFILVLLVRALCYAAVRCCVALFTNVTGCLCCCGAASCTSSGNLVMNNHFPTTDDQAWCALAKCDINYFCFRW